MFLDYPFKICQKYSNDRNWLWHLRISLQKCISGLEWLESWKTGVKNLVTLSLCCKYTYSIVRVPSGLVPRSLVADYPLKYTKLFYITVFPLSAIWHQQIPTVCPNINCYAIWLSNDIRCWWYSILPHSSSTLGKSAGSNSTLGKSAGSSGTPSMH